MKVLRAGRHAVITVHGGAPIPEERVDRSGGLAELVAALIPGRAIPRRWRGEVKRLVVTTFEPSPPCPEPELLLAFLYRDPARALEEVRAALGLRSVRCLAGPAAPPRGTLVTDVEGFSRLHGALTAGTVGRGVFLTVFVEAGWSLCLRVAEGSLLEEVISGTEDLATYRAAHEGIVVRRLLDGEPVDPRLAPVVPELSPLTVTREGRLFAPRGRLLFPFPPFRRSLAVRAPLSAPEQASPCTNCLACATVCPARLYPSSIAHHLQRGLRDEAVALRVEDCVHCGACSFVCPAGIPLAQTIAAPPGGAAKGGAKP